ncbi:MAG: non-homologous end-joining DNA ligase [Phycisphaerales bacterium]
MQQESKTITIEGKKLTLTNLSKVLYPQTGFTKAGVIDYYYKMANYILPHLHERPVTLKRYPQGVDAEHFYQKNCPLHKPDWIKTSKPDDYFKENFCLVNDLPSLIWIENLASIEIHTLLSTTRNLERPTMLVFDLDPGEPAGLLDCLKVAIVMRDMLAGLGLKTFPKTSGGKGLHFYLPLNTVVTFEQTGSFAKTVAQIMEKHFPDLVVSKMNKDLRKGKVFVDWSQNSRHKTTATVYTLRARSQPTVSMPVSWQDIENALKNNSPDKLIYTAEHAIKKVQKDGDIFNDVLTLRQSLSSEISLRSKPEKITKTQREKSLKKYRQKRDFTKTAEPAGRKKVHAESIFVIHKHAATRLHYDLRLQSEGVLKSWAVPKGLSTNPKERRLAVRTEDHPFEHKDFEGVIPEGQYGAGQVIIWDKGTYKNITLNSKGLPVSMKDAIKKGKLEVFFNGNKTKGGYALIRLKTGEDEKENWLVIKLKDKYVDSLPDDLQELGQSVESGKTIKGNL